jgi:hypothetical protein
MARRGAIAGETMTMQKDSRQLEALAQTDGGTCIRETNRDGATNLDDGTGRGRRNRIEASEAKERGTGTQRMRMVALGASLLRAHDAPAKTEHLRRRTWRRHGGNEKR